MQKGETLEFCCPKCEKAVHFSVLPVETTSPICSGCHTTYHFGPQIVSQLQQFEGLCRQIQASKDILGKGEIGVDVAGSQVKIPFKLLLTRFNSLITLEFEGKSLQIRFRLEPLAV